PVATSQVLRELRARPRGVDSVMRPLERAALVAIVLAVVNEPVVDPASVGLAKQLGAAAADTEHEVGVAGAMELLNPPETPGLQRRHGVLHAAPASCSDNDEAHRGSLKRAAMGCADTHVALAPHAAATATCAPR